MEHLDFLFDKIIEFNKSAADIPFDEEDIRKSYFGFHESLLRNYYRGYCYIVIDEDLKAKNIAIGENSKFFKHLQNKKRIIDFHSGSHLHNLNRRVFLDCWSNFETCLTVLVNGLASDIERIKLLNFKVSNIVDSLKKIGFKISKDQLKNEFIEGHLTHVPISRKVDFVYKKVNNGYSRNISKDKEFIKFFGRFRNTMHSNFIYYGNNYEYRFGNAHFIFKNEEIVKWYDPFEGTPKLQVYLVNNLMEIWKEMIFNIKHDSIIPYPCSEQE